MKISKLFTASAFCLMLLLSMSNDAIGQSRKQPSKSSKSQTSQIKKITPRVEAGLNGEYTVKPPVTAPGYENGDKGIPGIINGSIQEHNNEKAKKKREDNKQKAQQHKHIESCIKKEVKPIGNGQCEYLITYNCVSGKAIMVKVGDEKVKLSPNDRMTASFIAPNNSDIRITYAIKKNDQPNSIGKKKH